jgi:MATE family multidrug resistance protein
VPDVRLSLGYGSLLILIISFFSKENRREYNTHLARFEPAFLLKILKIGYPNAIAQAAIAGAWSCFFILMNKLGEASITLASFMQTLTGFFVFLIQGLSRGVIAIAANFIGGRKTNLVSRVLFSGIEISLFFSLIILLAFLIQPLKMQQLFFNPSDLEKVSNYFGTLKLALLWGWLAFVCKSIRALLSGLLTASGNTQFVMWNEVISVWLCFIVPIWICTEFFSFNVSGAYFIAFLYNFIAAIIYYFKFSTMDWKKEGQLI